MIKFFHFGIVKITFFIPVKQIVLSFDEKISIAKSERKYKGITELVYFKGYVGWEIIDIPIGAVNFGIRIVLKEIRIFLKIKQQIECFGVHHFGIYN